MDLEALLSGELFNSKSLKTIADATEVKASDIKKVLTGGIPILMQGMVQNTQTKTGEKSLIDALTDHTEEPVKSLTTYLKNADVKDGTKIVKKVLGEEESNIAKGLSKATGVTSSKVKKILAYIAPLLLRLLGIETANTSSSSTGISSLLSSFLGGSSLNNSSVSLGDISSLLLGKPANASNDTVSLLTSLLGGGSQPAAQSGGSILSSLLGGSSYSQSGGSLLSGGNSAQGGASLLSALLGSGSSSSSNNSSANALSLLGTLLMGR